MINRSGLNLLPAFILHPIRILNNLIPGGHRHEFANYGYNDSDRDSKYFFENYENQLFLNDKEIEIGNKILNEMGLSNKDRFVCLIVRDNEYLKNYLGGVWEYHTYRNYEIENFATKFIFSNEFSFVGTTKLVKCEDCAKVGFLDLIDDEDDAVLREHVVHLLHEPFVSNEFLFFGTTK